MAYTPQQQKKLNLSRLRQILALGVIPKTSPNPGIREWDEETQAAIQQLGYTDFPRPQTLTYMFASLEQAISEARNEPPPDPEILLAPMRAFYRVYRKFPQPQAGKVWGPTTDQQAKDIGVKLPRHFKYVAQFDSWERAQKLILNQLKSEALPEIIGGEPGAVEPEPEPDKTPAEVTAASTTPFQVGDRLIAQPPTFNGFYAPVTVVDTVVSYRVVAESGENFVLEASTLFTPEGFVAHLKKAAA